LDGKFVLKAPATAKTLSISFVGMASIEVPITGSANYTIKLKSENISVNEVVVTAMGITKEKKALGYAVQDVKSDELTQGSNSDLSGALQGKLSGVEITPSSGMPGASSKITIRGSRSFTGDNTPLYVVDGMPISSANDVSTGNSVTGTDFANRSVDIDPNDIESVNILKGQAASALYGMRASNGVVVITTKSGKSARHGKPEISFNSSVAFDAISVMPDLQTKYAQGSGGTFAAVNSFSWGPQISDLSKDTKVGGDMVNANTTRDGMKPGMYYVQQRANAGLDPWAKPQVYNNASDFFNTGSTYNNSFNIAQGFDKGDYSFSLGNTTTKGIVPTTGMDRYNAKLSANAILSENWSTAFQEVSLYQASTSNHLRIMVS